MLQIAKLGVLCFFADFFALIKTYCIFMRTKHSHTLAHILRKTMNDKDYQEWERQVEEAKKHNNRILIEFENYLKTKLLKPNTIKNHIDNVEFYANDFLLRYEIIPIEKGFLEIGSFLGDFFIRKASWASKYTIKENIASFKKFYTFLNETGEISKNELNEMKELIKEEKADWIEEVENYWNNIENDW